MQLSEQPASSESDLGDLEKTLAVVEAQVKLSRAQSELADIRRTDAKRSAPWWRNGTVVTAIAAMISSIIPLTAQIQSWKEQAMKEKELNFNIRDKYLSAVMRDPRQEQRVLEFIVATTDDTKVSKWAAQQLEKTNRTIDSLNALRNNLYLETIKVVAALADKALSNDDWIKNYEKFWHLYRTDLLPVESKEVEGLMVRLGRQLPSNNRAQAGEVENLSYELARQMKAEMAAEAIIPTPATRESNPR